MTLVQSPLLALNWEFAKYTLDQHGGLQSIIFSEEDSILPRMSLDNNNNIHSQQTQFNFLFWELNFHSSVHSHFKFGKLQFACIEDGYLWQQEGK